MTETLANRRVFRSKVDSIRPTYGFEDVSLAPGTDTVEPADVDLAQEFCGLHLDIPVLAAAMDAVVDARLPASWPPRRPCSSSISRASSPATRTRPRSSTGSSTPPTTRSRMFSPRPTCPDSRGAGRPPHRGAPRGWLEAAVAATPGIARTYGPACAEHGADLFLVQSQVSSARHIASGYEPLALEEFTRFMPIPVAVGNTTNAQAAFLLMEQGAAAIFVGVGPGAACTTREVLGIGIPQVTAIADVTAARDAYLAETGRYVPVVADGGMKRGGDIAKAIAAGADVVMLGSPLARAAEAPGRGTNWGMAAPSPVLPRGTRIKVGTVGPLDQILNGPSHVTDGTQNLMGALRQSMAALGARTIADMHDVEIVYAPAVVTEGKSWQLRGK